ncbi:hypothetical protein [Albibacillus kandeliae]|uniref:hypothetical protein n=1 Tax=Albibacillus kandeliae TaxID=2174228 RepID=UPI001300BC72|nr:hypothetical protein [Albibacillus kandeliae]
MGKSKVWEPDPSEPIGKNERIGRRIWDTPKLRGADTQPDVAALDIEIFRERRSKEVSLDRLGRTGIEKRVISYLQPRCELHGASFSPNRRFDGWATIQAEKLTNKWNNIPKWSISASPVEGNSEVPNSDNRYHAHAVCDGSDNDLTVALFLRHLFERYGDLHPAPTNSPNEQSQSNWLKSLITAIRRSIFRDR